MVFVKHTQSKVIYSYCNCTKSIKIAFWALGNINTRQTQKRLRAQKKGILENMKKLLRLNINKSKSLIKD